MKDWGERKPTREEIDAPGTYDYLGMSANEDKIAPLVPESIELLLQAGITTLMLTGDNQVTATAIGFQVRLIKPSNRVIEVVGSPEEVQSILKGKFSNNDVMVFNEDVITVYNIL